MPQRDEIRRLTRKWVGQTGWPKRLSWIKIENIRGWVGERIDFTYPITALVGENGVGKSTVLQCAASVYAAPARTRDGAWNASDFFPNTAWERLGQVEINYLAKEGTNDRSGRISKPTVRWRNNPPERPERFVAYFDLSRVQPLSRRVGFFKLAKSEHKETLSEPFDSARLARFSAVMGRDYASARMSITDADPSRPIPVLNADDAEYSGFHMGSGETTIAELLRADLPPTSLVLIDEIETSLHPRAQRRIIRELATMCRDRDLQIILTTHSPVILDELPPEARVYILSSEKTRSIVYGVSPEYAMTSMDEVTHHECDVYVEDDRAKVMLAEMLRRAPDDLVRRCLIATVGAASAARALGGMVSQARFHRPTCVFLDGDQGVAAGCHVLPGDDSPEHVVFRDLKGKEWCELPDRIGMPLRRVKDACASVMTLPNEHEWLGRVSEALGVDGDVLWYQMCREWTANCAADDDVQSAINAVTDAIARIAWKPPAVTRPSKRPIQPKPSTGTFAPNPQTLTFFDPEPTS